MRAGAIFNHNDTRYRLQFSFFFQITYGGPMARAWRCEVVSKPLTSYNMAHGRVSALTTLAITTELLSGRHAGRLFARSSIPHTLFTISTGNAWQQHFYETCAAPAPSELVVGLVAPRRNAWGRTSSITEVEWMSGLLLTIACPIRAIDDG